MLYLILVSCIWAFSFGLTKGLLKGVDPGLAAALRLLLALLLFLPFFRPGRLLRRPGLVVQLLAVGAVQFGLMYLFYNASFLHLAAWEVAIFTVFTPLYVTLLDGLEKRAFHPRFWLAALVATLGALVIFYRRPDSAEILYGFWLVQLSNLCFAFGQVRYRNLLAATPDLRDHQIFALPCLGAALTALVATVLFSARPAAVAAVLALTPKQGLTLLYLGFIGSGLGFFLWNTGARRVNAGTLAAFNNLKIPLAVACSLLFFHETTNLPRLLAGGSLLIVALLLNERRTAPART